MIVPRTHSLKQWKDQARSGGQHRHPASTMPPPMASSLDPNEGLRRDAEKIEGDWRQVMGLHPLTDPGDGRTQCEGCNQYVWPVIHSCKGIKR